MRRREFIRAVAGTIGAAGMPLAAWAGRANSVTPRLVLFDGRLVAVPGSAGIEVLDTGGELPALWERQLKRRPVRDLLPMAGLTTHAELDLLRQALGGSARSRLTAADSIVSGGTTLVGWRIESA